MESAELNKRLKRALDERYPRCDQVVEITYTDQTEGGYMVGARFDDNKLTEEFISTEELGSK